MASTHTEESLMTSKHTGESVITSKHTGESLMTSTHMGQSLMTPPTHGGEPHDLQPLLSMSVSMHKTGQSAASFAISQG